MDPEDLHEVISAYNRCVAETVRRFGGFVAKYMGDGVLVYFGYGLRLLDECLDQIERPGWHEGVWVAEVLRLKGWVLIRQGRRSPSC
jgi:class 3 adenylate cyclase